MMHRCSSNMVGQCTCGLFHSQTSCNSFTMLLSVPNNNHNHKSYYNNNDESDMYYSSYASTGTTSSSVDCTLSLGTPSTRLSEDDDHKRSSSRMSNFCWDILQSKNSPNYNYPPQNHKTSRAGGITNNSANSDPLLARRCANCDTTSTPLWRNGPRGPKSLCNACGIRFKKEERRATAANASSNSNNGSAGTTMEQQQHYGYQNNAWIQTQKMPCYSPANEFRFIEDNDGESETGIPFLSWRLNVTDRPGLVHDFTR
ncbi:GATA transcription factor 19 [Mercurialis annua]|uniref:GATA transcription factor 19 n=1 Tax=Mercurialis annua TaxID=3986 RepID=UPI002160CEB9|nr:GATA transcription factor 19 [Mercurialis annua]